jgi:hypothetical protein
VCDISLTKSDRIFLIQDSENVGRNVQKYQFIALFEIAFRKYEPVKMQLSKNDHRQEQNRGFRQIFDDPYLKNDMEYEF